MAGLPNFKSTVLAVFLVSGMLALALSFWALSQSSGGTGGTLPHPVYLTAVPFTDPTRRRNPRANRVVACHQALQQHERHLDLSADLRRGHHLPTRKHEILDLLPRRQLRSAAILQGFGRLGMVRRRLFDALSRSYVHAFQVHRR